MTARRNQQIPSVMYERYVITVIHSLSFSSPTSSVVVMLSSPTKLVFWSHLNRGSHLESGVLRSSERSPHASPFNVSIPIDTTAMSNRKGSFHRELVLCGISALITMVGDAIATMQNVKRAICVSIRNVPSSSCAAAAACSRSGFKNVLHSATHKGKEMRRKRRKRRVRARRRSTTIGERRRLTTNTYRGV